MDVFSANENSEIFPSMLLGLNHTLDFEIEQVPNEILGMILNQNYTQLSSITTSLYPLLNRKIQSPKHRILVSANIS